MSLGSIELIILSLICLSLVLLAGIVVAAIVFVSRSSSSRVPCPYCKERIMPGATVCRFCGREIGPTKDQVG